MFQKVAAESVTEGFLFLKADGEGGPDDRHLASSWFYLMESCAKAFVGSALIR